MMISWYGFNYFKVQNSQSSLIFNPYSLSQGAKMTKASSSIILFTDAAKVASAKVDKSSFIVDAPGEYEVNGVFVYGKQVNGQIIYNAVFENIKIAFLGEFGHKELSNGDLELIEGADILILPIGGGDLLTAKEANRIISQVEPRIVIPSCYSTATLSSFIKEFGVKAENVDKLKISKKDLPQEDIKLTVLKKQ